MMERRIGRVLAGALLAALALMLAAPAGARTVVDMTGREVVISRKIEKVWPAYPPLSYLVYAVDPSLMIGWTGPLPAGSRKYIGQAYRDLPAVGGWFGQRTPNMESLAAIRPDCALVWDQSLSVTPQMADTLQKLGIPVVAVRLFRLSDYPAAFRFVGTVLERRERAETLALYIEKTMREMKEFSDRIPEKQKVSVYYAIGPDGLTADCDHLPFLEEAIGLAGGRSSHRCEPADRALGKKIDLERLLVEDPDVIIAQDDVFLSKVFSDPRYGRLRAVKNGRVYSIPRAPFNWLNYPPSFMRAVGIKWLADVLYPGARKADLTKEVQTFFRLFLNTGLTGKEVLEILTQPDRKAGKSPANRKGR